MIDRVPSPLQSQVLAVNKLYMAVHVISVRRAFCLLCKGAAEVVSIENGAWIAYDFDGWRELSGLRASLGDLQPTDEWIRSVSFEIQVPRVIRLLSYDRVPRNSVKFTRRNIFLRDDYRCQYCERTFGASNLSLDHVVPRSHGGSTTWENIVTACLRCNVRKGGRTPEQASMNLLRRPFKPQRNPLFVHRMNSNRYEAWKPFLD